MPEKSDGREGRGEMPSTIARSSEKAQRTWQETHDSAVETHGEGERAHRTAYASLKHSFERQGDRWVEKKKKGPSDSRAAASPAEARAGKGKTHGGVDVCGHSKKELMDRARQMGIKGRSRMTKDELGDAIARKQR